MRKRKRLTPTDAPADALRHQIVAYIQMHIVALGPPDRPQVRLAVKLLRTIKRAIVENDYSS